MILRTDKLLIELPRPAHPSPNSAAAIQELVGGRFGTLSTLMTYTFQSFNFRRHHRLRPFHDLVVNIAAEEFAHLELAAYAINLLLTGHDAESVSDGRRASASGVDARHVKRVISGQGALPVDSIGAPWSGSSVFASGNLKLDLLHNFFLECGARSAKIRVYEMVDDPTARQMVGYLLVRDSVHIVAYAKAIEALSGVSLGQLLPVPDITNSQFPEAKAYEDQGLHQVLYRFSEHDYGELSHVWTGAHPEDGSPLRVVDGHPAGVDPPNLDEEPRLAVPLGPELDPSSLQELARRLFK